MSLAIWSAVAVGCLGLASHAPAQRFGFTHQMFPGEANSARAVALGDVDGDGDLDAFVGNSDFQQNRLYLNGGTGVFTDVTATNLPPLPDDTRAIALGDVDGDGDLDALVGNHLQQSRLYLNGGTGVFTDVTATSLPTLLDATRAIALGDVDGDGDLDALVGNQLQQSRLCLNGGTGVFTDVTATNLPVVVVHTPDVTIGDVDGDGDLDAFVGNRLYLNGGTGVFADVSGTNLPPFSNSLGAVSALGDVDGDGDLDAVTSGNLLLNGGTGFFTDVTATNLPAGFGGGAVVLGDVNGDGALDAFVGITAAFGAQSRLYLNGGTGIFTDVTATNLPAHLDFSTALALGDVDGDGDLDAFTGNGGWPGQQDRLYLNGGTGVFTDVTATGPPVLLDDTHAVALGDVDGDGDLDAFVGNAGPPPTFAGQNRLHLNGGTGLFTDVSATNLPALLDNTTGVALGDVDGDGDLDAFVGNAGSYPTFTAQNLLLLNGGTGVFTDVTATNLPMLLDRTTAVALGDVDGDGDLDAFVTNYQEQNRLYLNGGTGVFTDVTATNLPPDLDKTTAVALGDVDGDGDLDAITGSITSGSRLYLNGGTGAFTDVTATNLPAASGGTQALALGDVDGDGDLDAFLGKTTGLGGHRLYLNGGTGVFADVSGTNLPALIDNTTAVALGDVDGDGDLDVFLGAGQNRLYLNAGTGVFTDVSGTNVPVPLVDFTLGIALGDVDGDGDLDAFAGNGTTAKQNRIYTNLARQVAWSGIPRAGKPLTLDVGGPANGTWMLAASLATASIPIPPFGTLRLSPATLFHVGSGTLDPQGRGSVTFLVPSSPTLVGVSVYWQALVGPPPLLTNLEITTVTNL